MQSRTTLVNTPIKGYFSFSYHAYEKLDSLQPTAPSTIGLSKEIIPKRDRPANINHDFVADWKRQGVSSSHWSPAFRQFTSKENFMRPSIRATEKYIALFILAVSFSALSLSAQTAVVTNPTTSQGITQPTGTGFGIGENNTSGGAPTLFGVGLTDTSDGSSPTLVNQGLNCFGQGSFGNNGTSAQGWAGCYLQSSTLFSSASGIDHVRSDSYTHSAQGDTALQYSYLTTFGGATAASDEGITPMVIHSNQMGYMFGSLDSTATTGATEILITGGFGCGGYCATFALGKKSFAQGGILFDKTRPAGTATLTGSNYTLRYPIFTTR
jgi:hypothetical protein